MRYRATRFILPLLAAIAVCPKPVHAAVLKSLVPMPFHISPNGDGVQDNMSVRYELTDTATVFLFVLAKDTVTVVDTLVAGVSRIPGAYNAAWSGTFSNGSPVGEDSYLLMIRATKGAVTESATQRVSVDLTKPQTSITDVQPAIFAPGVDGQPSPLKIDFLLIDAPPTDSADVEVQLVGPSGTKFTIMPSTRLSANESHRATWDGKGATADGMYGATIAVTDPGGNKGAFSSTVNIDVAPPTVAFTSPKDNMHFRVLPDSLFGFTRDRNGVVSLKVRYATTDTFEVVQSTRLESDTLFFAVPLASRITTSAPHVITFQSTDPVSRQATVSFNTTYDTIPPNPPVLNAVKSPTRSSTVILDGTVTSDTNVMRIYRNGALADTIYPNLPGGLAQFPYEMPLVPGMNRIRSIAVDQAGNASVFSNEIAVVFDNTAGLTMPQPFAPNDHFLINLPSNAGAAHLRIFDLGGNLVARLDHNGSTANLSILWNGLNGDGDPVKRGPLVAVVKVDYEDGGHGVFREIFLYDPEGVPSP